MGTRGPTSSQKHQPRGEEIQAPPHLSPEAAAIFQDTVLACKRGGYALGVMDSPMLELYATARADAQLHEIAVLRDGWTMTSTNGYAYPNPRVAMRDAALKRAAGAAKNLGLAKVDRRRIDPSSTEHEDPFAKFSE